MEELIKALVVPLIENPEQIQILKQEDSGCITYILTVAKQDMGKVIGRNGQVVSAIRTVISSAASAEGKNIRFLIRE
ncbi:KH domain-containing protein [Sporolactobacillus shoreae]|uniref:RNA-binding protein KhpA n=1 Tax=Sporolactobacillus shoreae TaxID=1465501 RepID=A0A4Z0GSN7_9BACL|nr:KH domain-containing protein [Sporolactobacillus shoreae]TGB00259.1 KH domain-containing protein [Sporolactobacillus shoreae]